MTTSEQIAVLFNKFAPGGNYAGVRLEHTLMGISWEKSVIKYHSCNSIAIVVFHID
jgi:hypothetical protein